MKIQIAARKCELTDEVRDRVVQLSEKWPKFDSALSNAQLIFRIDGRDHVVEVILSIDRRDQAVAKGQADNFRAALDDLDQKVTRLLRRQREKRTHHQAERASKAEM